MTRSTRPVRVWVEGNSIVGAAHHHVRLLKALLSRIMASGAHGLPILLVPKPPLCGSDPDFVLREQGIVESVWLLVVDHRRGALAARLLAFAAQWMLGEKAQSFAAPAAVVAPLGAVCPRRLVRNNHRFLPCFLGELITVMKKRVEGRNSKRMEVTLGPHWRAHTEPVAGLTFIGTVQRGMHIGALAYNTTGQYFAVNKGRWKLLTPRKISAALEGLKKNPDAPDTYLPEPAPS